MSDTLDTFCRLL